MDRSITTIKADLAHTEFGARGEGIVWAHVGSGVDGGHRHFVAHQNLELPVGLNHLDMTTMSEDAIRTVLRGNREGETVGNVGQTMAQAIDTHGVGTGEAAIIAGQSSHQNRQLIGMAPSTKVLSVCVTNERGAGREWSVLAALQMVQAVNDEAGEIVVHGLSLGVGFLWDAANYACGQSPVCVEVDRLVNAGVVVVASAGNFVSTSQERRWASEASISDPGNARNAITVGSTHRNLPELYGPSYFSGRGPTADGRMKPDLLAPGEKLFTCSVGNRYGSFDGTGFATAHVAGVCAALMSVRRELISKPLEVKQLLMRTAVDLGRERTYQGAGLVDLAAALRDEDGDAATEKSRAHNKAPLKVFVSYSHRDKALWEEFKDHLKPLERGKRIEVWSDLEIKPGDKWEQAIFKQMNDADIVLLLVSSHFVASDFCWTKEMKRVMKRDRGDGSIRVIPVRVRPVTLKDTALDGLQALPPEAKPITSFSDPHEGWAQVTESLHAVVAELRGN